MAPTDIAPDVLNRALGAGRATFGADWRPQVLARAPGRIELIGNHLDYNGGPVLAAAIDRSIVVLVEGGNQARDDVAVVMADTTSTQSSTFSIPALAGWKNQESRPDSHDYVRGALASLLNRDPGWIRPGCRLAVAGDVPIGFGVSSSAALCVSLILAMSSASLSPRDLVLLAQEAEHRAGTPCGTMDQSASVAGGVIRFDGATLEVRSLTPELGDHAFVIADSGVERSLGASSYPVRVKESEAALAMARTRLRQDISHIATLNHEDLSRLQALRDDTIAPALKKRVRHVVTETHRVEDGLAALLAADWVQFGELMTASGRSSATDYEISHVRVEELVGEALESDGVLGARMMGGGEGGAVLILLKRGAVDVLEQRLRDDYYTRYDMASNPGLIHACSFASGAGLSVFDEHHG